MCAEKVYSHRPGVTAASSYRTGWSCQRFSAAGSSHTPSNSSMSAASTATVSTEDVWRLMFFRGEEGGGCCKLCTRLWRQDNPWNERHTRLHLFSVPVEEGSFASSPAHTGFSCALSWQIKALQYVQSQWFMNRGMKKKTKKGLWWMKKKLSANSC